ncbi:hypothetical protein MBM_06455 [Drepanopeziza brunnea f. sp. 'multigermtubi' MB_m1]|uniref:Uncharacterized protein n=1 Tax=Marssonina brunnea f. sp. multigermtubi (strain MB_m1) TaxID=1072389 RepID=K1XRM5_MARBU|nr:uncharacterized protein MBM_06455 [Drepanopeziza brunnea f. sp. 'multigermtubi' MB_m1]EKD15239.1 hypothetical protein MBM_06455 [Drepanopeziza brunnea f. sp. 'multigermtubi' MB_m1]
MIFVNAIVAAALAASIVTAAPAKVAIREDRKIKLCKDKNYNKCVEPSAPSNTCVNTASLDTGNLDDQISSLDTYGLTCFIYA